MNAAAGSVTILNGSNDGAVVFAGSLTINGLNDLAQLLGWFERDDQRVSRRSLRLVS